MPTGYSADNSFTTLASSSVSDDMVFSTLIETALRGPARVSIEIALATKPTEAPVWTDVTPFVEAFSIRRGRQGPLETAGAGSATVRLSNQDRRFDPRHATGPYFSLLKPMRRLRIRGMHGGREAEYATVVMADRPRAYWRLGEASGTSAADVLGVSPGTYTGTLTLNQSGALTEDTNPAVTFGGGRITVPTSATINLPTTHSIEAWVRPTGSANYLVYDKAYGSAGQPQLGLGSGKVTYYPHGAILVTSIATLIANAWTHLVCTFDGSTARIYLNGALDKAEAFSATVTSTALDAGIGASAGGVNPLAGKLDEVAIYPTTLPAARVLAHYQAGTTGRGITYDLFHGYISGWPQSRENYGHQTVTLSCTDAFKVLQLAEVNATYALQRSDERIAAVLTAANWLTGQGWVLGDATYGLLGLTTILGPVGDRALDQGQSQVQATTLADTSALSHIQAVEQSENGYFFIGKSGEAAFHSRHRRFAAGTSASHATFGDSLTPGSSSGELPYVSATLDYDDSQIYNDVHVTRTGGIEQVATDSTSQLDYFKRSYSRSVLVPTDGEALSVASYIKDRYKEPQYRITSLVLDPEYDTGQVYPQLLGRELNDVVTVRATPLGGGSRIEQVSFIEGMAIDWNAAGGVWRGEWQLSVADTQQYWFLGLSALGTQTRLGY